MFCSKKFQDAPDLGGRLAYLWHFISKAIWIGFLSWNVFLLWNRSNLKSDYLNFSLFLLRKTFKTCDKKNPSLNNQLNSNDWQFLYKRQNKKKHWILPPTWKKNKEKKSQVHELKHEQSIVLKEIRIVRNFMRFSMWKLCKNETP